MTVHASCSSFDRENEVPGLRSTRNQSRGTPVWKVLKGLVNVAMGLLGLGILALLIGGPIYVVWREIAERPQDAGVILGVVLRIALPLIGAVVIGSLVRAACGGSADG